MTISRVLSEVWGVVRDEATDEKTEATTPAFCAGRADSEPDEGAFLSSV